MWTKWALMVVGLWVKYTIGTYKRFYAMDEYLSASPSHLCFIAYCIRQKVGYK